MRVSFEGIGESVVTFFNSETDSAGVGVPVKMSGNGEVSACAAGERFFGVSIISKEGFAAIQTDGYVEIAYSGAAPEPGFARLAANGDGSVRVDAAGGEFLIINVNDETLGFML